MPAIITAAPAMCQIVSRGMLHENANDIADRNLDSHRARFPHGTSLTVPKTADSESENVVSTLKLTALPAGNGLDRSANALHPLKNDCKIHREVGW